MSGTTQHRGGSARKRRVSGAGTDSAKSKAPPTSDLHPTSSDPLPATSPTPTPAKPHPPTATPSSTPDEAEDVSTQHTKSISGSDYTHSGGSGGVSMWFERSGEEPPLVCSVELNVVWWVVVMLGFLVRFWRLDFPCYVVFDEVHFGKFASYYLQGTFFFDVHPPLGKLLFALVGYLSGFDGSYLFPSIGSEYPLTVPYVTMRGVSAFTGSLLVACVYEIMVELGFTHKSAAMAAIFTVFDNSLVVQSRVIMLDSLLILFTYSSILAYLKFYRHRHAPFSFQWHRGLAITGLSLGCLLGIKYTGLLGVACVGLLALCDLWQLAGNHSLSMLVLVQHTVLRGVYLLGIPLLGNLLLFYVHLCLLSQAGPGNAFVSLAFRNSLEGSMDLSPTVHLSPNATLLRYGSSFSVRSAELSCWLHSHNHTYPLKYPDGRGSSFQQQVTCYDFRDTNNIWVIRKPRSLEDVSILEDGSPVRNGDEVELFHLGTEKLLNSHDVAAPLSPALQEVAGYINYSAQFVPHLKWKLDVAGLDHQELVFWERGKLKLKFLHTYSKQALSCSSKRLPEWGFQQYEVVTDRVLQGPHVLWGIEDLSLPNVTSSEVNRTREEQEIRESLSRRAPQVDSNESGDDKLSFLAKFFELQEHMANAHSNLGDHTFGASPHSWPLMEKTLPYWLDEKSNAQVTLLGNPVLWWTSTAAIHAFLMLTTFYLMRRQRKFADLGTTEYQHWWTSGCVLMIGWLIHYTPYFLLSRVLFLHHYLPALPFKFMLLAAVCEHVHTWVHRWSSLSQLLLPIFYLFISFLLVAVVASYLTFAPFTYGYPALSTEQISWRAWVETWDLLHR